MYTGNVPVILMYHSISPYQADPYLVTVRPERFDQQMQWLRRRGLTGVSVQRLLTMRRNGRGRGLVGLTFDDGYADFVVYGLPILQFYRFTATVFPVLERLGRDNAWDVEGPRKPLMTDEQLREVAAAGIEIGSHGLHHVSLVSAADAELTCEVQKSRRVLCEISGQEVDGFCYPYGHIDGRVRDQVRAAGYSYGCAIWWSALTGPYALPRTHVADTDSSPRMWVKGVSHWLRSDYRGPGALRPVSIGAGSRS